MSNQNKPAPGLFEALQQRGRDLSPEDLRQGGKKVVKREDIERIADEFARQRGEKTRGELLHYVEFLEKALEDAKKGEEARSKALKDEHADALAALERARGDAIAEKIALDVALADARREIQRAADVAEKWRKEAYDSAAVAREALDRAAREEALRRQRDAAAAREAEERSRAEGAKGKAEAEKAAREAREKALAEAASARERSDAESQAARQKAEQEMAQARVRLETELAALRAELAQSKERAERGEAARREERTRLEDALAAERKALAARDAEARAASAALATAEGRAAELARELQGVRGDLSKTAADLEKRGADSARALDDLSVALQAEMTGAQMLEARLKQLEADLAAALSREGDRKAVFDTLEKDLGAMLAERSKDGAARAERGKLLERATALGEAVRADAQRLGTLAGTVESLLARLTAELAAAAEREAKLTKELAEERDARAKADHHAVELMAKLAALDMELEGAKGEAQANGDRVRALEGDLAGVRAALAEEQRARAAEVQAEKSARAAEVDAEKKARAAEVEAERGARQAEVAAEKSAREKAIAEADARIATLETGKREAEQGRAAKEAEATRLAGDIAALEKRSAEEVAARDATIEEAKKRDAEQRSRIGTLEHKVMSAHEEHRRLTKEIRDDLATARKKIEELQRDIERIEAERAKEREAFEDRIEALTEMIRELRVELRHAVLIELRDERDLAADLDARKKSAEAASAAWGKPLAVLLDGYAKEVEARKSRKIAQIQATDARKGTHEVAGEAYGDERSWPREASAARAALAVADALMAK